MPPSARALVGHTMSDVSTLIRTDEQGMLFLRDLAGALVQQGKLFYVTDRVTLAIARKDAGSRQGSSWSGRELSFQLLGGLPGGARYVGSGVEADGGSS